MSKYKLIKKYPNCLHDIGTIIPHGGMGWKGIYAELESGLYSEFWELVKEKEWEILSTITKWETKTESYFSVSISRDEIKSIKRLCDNEVFSVGDKVEHSYTYGNDTITKTCTIEKIYTLDDGSMRFYVGGGLNLGLEKLKKHSPKVIFTTEDGVEINSDRKIFGVALSNNIGYKAYDLTEHDYKYKSSINLIGFKWFVDKGKAIAYINLNKPRYSMKNLLDAKVLSSDAAGYPALFIDLNKLK